MVAPSEMVAPSKLVASLELVSPSEVSVAVKEVVLEAPTARNS